MKYLIQLMLLLGWSLQGVAQNVSVASVQILIHGTSSLHDWTSEAKESKLTLQVNSENGKVTGISSVNLKVPVKGIKSTKGSIMDNKTYDALKADKFPEISFQLNKISNVSSSGTVSASGKLTIAGKTKDVVLSAKMKDLGGGSYEVTGTHPVKMTEYDMKPPTAMMGAIKVGDDVRIEYTVKFIVR